MEAWKWGVPAYFDIFLVQFKYGGKKIMFHLGWEDLKFH